MATFDPILGRLVNTDASILAHDSNVDAHGMSAWEIPSGYKGLCHWHVPFTQVSQGIVEAIAVRITSASGGGLADIVHNRIFAGSGNFLNNRAVLETIDPWTKVYYYWGTDNFAYISGTIGDTTNALKAGSTYTPHTTFTGIGTLTGQSCIAAGTVNNNTLYHSISLIANGGTGQIMRRDIVVSAPPQAIGLLVQTRNCSTSYSFSGDRNCVFWGAVLCVHNNAAQNTNQRRSYFSNFSSMDGQDLYLAELNIEELANKSGILHILSSNTYRASEATAGSLAISAGISPFVEAIYWK